jgi:hypothetical protein
VLAAPLALQRFEPIAGRHPEIIQRSRLVQHTQLAGRRAESRTVTGCFAGHPVRVLVSVGLLFTRVRVRKATALFLSCICDD